jgi:hypothetical protein
MMVYIQNTHNYCCNVMVFNTFCTCKSCHAFNFELSIFLIILRCSVTFCNIKKSRRWVLCSYISFCSVTIRAFIRMKVISVHFLLYIIYNDYFLFLFKRMSLYFCNYVFSNEKMMIINSMVWYHKFLIFHHDVLLVLWSFERRLNFGLPKLL